MVDRAPANSYARLVAAVRQNTCTLLVDPLVLTGYAWLIPAIFAAMQSHALLTVSPLVVLFLSTGYHLKGGRAWLLIDILAANLYIGVGFYLLTDVTMTWSSLLPHSISLEFLTGFWECLGIVALAVTTYLLAKLARGSKNGSWYVWFHSGWHLGAVGMAMAVYMTYFGYWFQN